MEVNVAIIIVVIAMCLVLSRMCWYSRGHRVNKLQKGHTMAQADKDARAAMYKELRECPDEEIKDASDKMSMRLQGAAPREMEGICMVRVRPGPAINLLFAEGSIPVVYRVETDDGFPAGNVEWSEREYGAKVLRITDLPVSPAPKTKPINIILDAPPGLTGIPGRGRFVDIQTDDGKSIGSDGWHPRPDGKWSMRITELPVTEPKKPWHMEEQPWLADLGEDNK